jgi:light-regulated signal transduction histidine kinase (bacteriophytochrome)
LSRVTRVEMSRRHVDLSHLAREVVAELRRQEPERAIEIAIADGLETEVDARLMRIVLENLFGNAWKFTRRTAAPRIEFGVESGEAGPIYHVRDNGAGFDMRYAEKLFRPFQRLHGEAEFPGTGIGLATIHRVIERHGGRIWTEAAIDQGATFFFTLGAAGASALAA